MNSVSETLEQLEGLLLLLKALLFGTDAELSFQDIVID